MIGLNYQTEKGTVENYGINIHKNQLLFENLNKCHLAIFADESLAQDTWYLGSHVMSSYYLVFDVTPLSEHKKDFI